ncbi:retinoblastoma-like protein 1 isoform X2 [Phymastichus coffea]|uniref:retinoblastoma-like protein 1 isoform X2 n=1 Tax=Phymastichus coffea TaxID=108790 RepID=UPI00273BB844|nr:retinoblastoma-like protein 1 isoform X2 [Phymastichus coffea]
MGLSDDLEDSIFMKHQDLCQKLNMDAGAANDAWKAYDDMRKRYSLEGDQSHWIGCALYVACRKTSFPTVGKSNTSIQGNCVSLTKLLTLCNMPLVEFFTKSKAWADMSNMPQDFGARIDTLQRNFSVSSVLFQKYQPIFRDIFKNPDDLSKPTRTRRHKAVACSLNQLFEFCWTLFTCIKSGIPTLSDDLVTSYHLLLDICDLMYSNALLANRKDLLNPDFPGLPENFSSEDFVPPKSANCIVDLLCERFKAIAIEAKSIKEYSLKPYLSRLFQEKILKGEQSNISGLLEALYFDGNNKAVNKAYEQHILSIGELDERIFLAECRRIRFDNESLIANGENWPALSKGPDLLIGNLSNKIPNVSSLEEQLQSRSQLGTMHCLAPLTPLTGRKYLKKKDLANAATISIPTQSVIKLQTLLVGCQAQPSENLSQVFTNSSFDTKTFVEAKVQKFAQLFCDAYSPPVPDNENLLNFGYKRAQSAQALFYKMLELVLADEMMKKPNFDVSTLLKNNKFLQCLYACCCEIVLYSYQNRDKSFPWILLTLNLEAYHFYKVIEVIVKVAVDQLTRDTVKHLNRIEEIILESLAWKSSSPLWEALENCEVDVPSYEEVALPGTFDLIDPNTPGQPVLRKIALDRNSQSDVPQSPVSSASERFQSPNITAAAKKRLFTDSKSGSQSVLKGQNLMAKLMEIDQPNLTKSNEICNGTAVNRDRSKPRRTGSLALFFRKFYHLTIARMQTLCNSLKIAEHDLKRKIWTIFEYSIKDKTNLMKDRHLDQILMCAVYVVCKLVKIQANSFTEIMKCYRLQPQAESHIYRSVFIRIATNQVDLENSNSNNSNPPPTPSGMAATSFVYGSEERGDLIKFYNEIYVPEVQDFAKRLGLNDNNSNLTLSPLPRYSSIASPSPVRRVTNSVMTRVLDPKEIAATPAPQLQYCFNRSPAKDLDTINRMITTVDARKSISKRLLSNESMVFASELDNPTKKNLTDAGFIARKIENIIGERRINNP